MVTLTALPSPRNCGGCCALPTPEGVPVRIISPGLSVKARDRYAINSSHAENHIAGRSVLFFDAVDGSHNAQVLWIGDLIGGDQAGTDGTERIEALGAHPLFVARLQVAGGDIVGDGVAEDVIEGVILRNAAGRSCR